MTEDTGVGGGHRDIFEHLNRLAARGHEVALYTLGDPPEWFDSMSPVHSFDDYDELGDALAQVDAIKVATWWKHGGAGVARERPARHSRSTSCRTSRPPTTPTMSARATRCSTPTARSSAT